MTAVLFGSLIILRNPMVVLSAKGFHWPSSHASNQAEKSIGAATGGTPMSPR